MGYAFCLGECIRCNRVFAFNPVKVPSIRVEGVREPICHPCFDYLNALRVGLGHEQWELPEHAYEPCDDEELG